MSLLEQAFRLDNLQRAWRWLRTNRSPAYKNYFRSLYGNYAVADDALLDQATELVLAVEQRLLGGAALADVAGDALDARGLTERLLRYAPQAADQLAGLKRRARAAGVPVVYANDNFGRWRSDLSAVVARCREPGCAGRAEITQPAGRFHRCTWR